MNTKIEFKYAKMINDLSNKIQLDNSIKGFWDTKRNVGELIALIHSELSEALEADRKNLQDTHLPHRIGIEVELADAFIRIMDMAAGLKLDLGGAVIEKLEYNRSRPHLHGNKY